MKPILFNTEMVRAILDGQKTMTRRLLKPRYKDDEYGFAVVTNKHTGQFVCVEKIDEDGGSFDDERIISPPYQSGDILYVRETFFEYRGKYYYKADGKHLELNALIGNKEFFKWHPSIHMPKEAARLFLKVTGVRMERLQEISNQDVIREGVKPQWRNGGCRCSAYQIGCLDKPCPNRDAYESLCHYAPFSELWDSTTPKKDLDRYGWNANPWVWVIEFERISKEDLLDDRETNHLNRHQDSP